MPTIECAKHPQKKATAHHVKTRPKKHQPYDKNRQGPTLYPAVAKPPPIWGLDNGDAIPDVWDVRQPKQGSLAPVVAPSS
jgi:50S ribosomal protein 6